MIGALLRRLPENAEALIASSFELLNAELGREIVERVHSFSPAFFERLIIDLLVRMGYGGGRAEMGRALGRVGDGGVDGVIKEDELGLDVVYVQAKWLEPDAGVPLREVRDFVGGLEGHRATKGLSGIVCGAIVTPMEGAYGNQERHPGQFAGGAGPEAVFAKDGLLDESKKALAERVLNAEIDDHLAAKAAAGKRNSRNAIRRRRC